MFKQLIYISCILLVLCITSSSMAELVAYYSMDEGSGSAVADETGNGHDGTIEGTPTWVDGVLDSDGAVQFGTAGSSRINCGMWDNTDGTGAMTVACWVKFATGGTQYQGILANRSSYNVDQMYWALETGATGGFYFGSLNGSQYGLGTMPNGEWAHLALSFDGTTLVAYLNGAVVATRTGAAYGNNPQSTVYIGASDNGGNIFEGAIDEVYFFSEILTVDDIIAIKNGEMKPSSSTAGLAKKPSPGSKSEDISIDVGMLSWTPGDYVAADGGTHDLFFGVDEANVAAATVSDPMGTMMFDGLDVNSVSIARLEYGTTYYWRVDEVNLPAKGGTNVGKVWAFTTEAEGIDLTPDTIIDVTSEAPLLFYPTQEPNMTCNGSGLDANDLHSSDVDNTMWLGIGDTYGDTWIQYEFDQIYKFHEILVWNYNEPDPGQYFGAKDVNITYSEDGLTWKALDDLVQLNIADGANGYAANTVVALDGAVAKFIKITFLNAWMDGIIGGGLSEVRFSVIPTRAMNPVPEDEAEDVEIGTELSWKAGRDADMHKVYIGSDPNEVKAGNADVIADTVDAMYAPALALGKTYYWKVDEVNDNEAHTTWDGPVWSFSTIESILVEGFEEGYDDSDVNAVYLTWLDGFDDTANGSVMGNSSPPYLTEDSHSGDYASPMTYDNTTAAYSEVVAETANLPIGTSDWSIGAPTTLTIWFFGDPNNIVGDSELYCKIGGKTATYSGPLDVLTLSMWRKWDIDLDTLGANLSNIPEITIGIKTKAGGSVDGSGVILLDDIMLTGFAPLQPTADIVIEAEDYVTLTSPMEVNDVVVGASGGQYIHVKAGTASATNGPTDPNGTATYNVDLTAGQYMIYGRVSVPNNNFADAFWVKVDGATSDRTLHSSGWARWNTIPHDEAWNWVGVWQDVNFAVGPVITWTVPEDGTVTIKVAYRDCSNALMPKLDALRIVKVGD